MVTLSGFLLFIGVYRLAIGEKIHDLTLCSICRLDVNIRMGDVVRWKNPRNETIHLIGKTCHAELNLSIPPKHTASHTFQSRGSCRYRASAHGWNFGIISVQSTKCSSVCNASKISDFSSGNLCRLNFDYVIHGKVSRYNYIMNNQQIVKKFVVLDIVDDYRQTSAQSTFKNRTSLQWMSPVEACFCPALRLGTEFIIMGYRSGSVLVIDTRTRASKWEPKLQTQLRIYRHKVKTPTCS